MKKIILILLILFIPIASAVIKDYTIITCKDVGCEIGTCEEDGYCYHNGVKERRSCQEVPSSCLESEGRLCYTARDYPVCVFLTEQEIIMRDKDTIGTKEAYINFLNSLKIGDTFINSDRPEFICNPQGEDWNFPQPSEDCWKVSVNYEKGYTMYNGDEVDLNDYLTSRLSLSGHYESCVGESGCNPRVDTWSNNFNLKINKDFLILNHLEDETYFVAKDKDEKMCFKINNKLANFNSEQSGFYIIQYNDILGMEKPGRFEKKEINIGENNYCLDIDTSMYGEVEYKINVYTYFGNKQIFDDESLIFRYKVVDEEQIIANQNINKQDDTTVIGYQSTECVTNEECNDYNSKTRDMCVNNKCVHEKSYLTAILLVLGIVVVLFIISLKGGR